MTDPTNVSAEPGGIWSSRRFVIASVVVALVIAMGLGVVISNLVGRDAADPVQPPPVTQAPPDPAVTPTATAADPASFCGLAEVKLSGTVTTPPEAEWSLVGTTAAPLSKIVGPKVLEPDGYRRCFAHSPEGAVIAAANFFAMGSKRTLYSKVAENSIAVGPGRDVLMGAQPTSSGGGVRVQIAGFRVLDYGTTAATVDLAFRTSKGATGSQVFDLVWEAGDWKFQVAGNGDLLNQPVQLPDLAGYIPWSGA